MKWFNTLYNVAWYRCHPLTGPVDADDETPAIYPTWRQAWLLARQEDGR